MYDKTELLLGLYAKRNVAPNLNLNRQTFFKKKCNIY